MRELLALFLIAIGFKSAMSGFKSEIVKTGDINSGGTEEYNTLYLEGKLSKQQLKPARGLGLDFSDQ
jgi:hypothetical protein